MGTNFYARKMPPKERKEMLKDLIDLSEDYDQICNEVQATYGRLDEYTHEGGVIHLGKRSGGWKFLWNPNWWEEDEGHYDIEKKEWVPKKVIKKFYDLTKESISEFLHRDDIKIFDEYGDEYDADDFLKEMFEWDKTKWRGVHELLDGESYAKECREKGEVDTYDRYGDCREAKWREWGFEPSYYNFYSDGLRFSTCIDFS